MEWAYDHDAPVFCVTLLDNKDGVNPDEKWGYHRIDKAMLTRYQERLLRDSGVSPRVGWASVQVWNQDGYNVALPGVGRAMKQDANHIWIPVISLDYYPLRVVIAAAPA